MSVPSRDSRPRRQPVFNLPTVVLALLGLMIATQFVQAVVLNDDQLEWLLQNFSFVPARYGSEVELPLALPGSEVWSFATYALLHDDWNHLLVNGLGLIIFGVPLARRFGTGRFLAFSLVGAIAGALAYLAARAGEGAAPDFITVSYMVGASAAVSAHIAAAVRFIYARPAGVPLRHSTYFPAARLGTVVRRLRPMLVIAAWLALNLVSGIYGIGAPEGVTIAWEAHIGGFLAGLLLFPLFDPIRTRLRPEEQPAGPDDPVA